jgi:hypothetical protein
MHELYSTPEWEEVRNLVRDKAHWICYYCGERGPMADHVLPRHLCKDPLDIKNLVCCCPICNEIAGGQKFKNRTEKRRWIRIERGIDKPVPVVAKKNKSRPGRKLYVPPPNPQAVSAMAEKYRLIQEQEEEKKRRRAEEKRINAKRRKEAQSDIDPLREVIHHFMNKPKFQNGMCAIPLPPAHTIYIDAGSEKPISFVIMKNRTKEIIAVYDGISTTNVRELLVGLGVKK